MANFNEAILVGNVVADPELHYTNSGTAVANFTLAVNSKVGENEEALFMPCVAFGKVADIIVKYTQKGKNVMLVGRLVLERWENKDGEKRSQIKLYIRTVQLLGSPTSANTTSEPDNEDF